MRHALNLLSLMLLSYISIVSADTNDNENNIAELNSAYSHYQNLAKEGKWKESLSYAKNAFEIGKQIHGEESKHTAALAQNYGSNLYKLGKNKQAEKLLNIALSIKEKTRGRNLQI
jgi:tetratricopeptide (TPR) repeat protein